MHLLDHVATDVERLLELDFVRCTEHAALQTLQWIGKGKKEMADAAACDAIRGMFDVMDICGEVVIGEGIKDRAPGLFKGERVGLWREGTTHYDIALDPIDGTTNVSKGLPNAISCLAAATRHDDNHTSLQDIPAYYMRKLAYSREVRQAHIDDPKLPIDIDAPVPELLQVVARILRKEVRDVAIMVLDRPRNQELIDAIRTIGATLRMIQDGDIAAALAPALPTSNIDLYMGIGGAPEGVLSAAALRCLGGGMQAVIWPRDAEERKSLAEQGWGDRFEHVFHSKDLARGREILFCATGINDSPLLRGVEVHGGTAITHSMLMRVQTGTIRLISAHHNLRTKRIHLRSEREHDLD